MGKKKALLLLVFFCLVLFLPAVLGSDFLWDDQQFVLDNLFLRSWRYVPEIFSSNMVQGAGAQSNLYRPFQLVTHLLDVQLWGMAPWAHRLTNVLLHALASCALFLVVLKVLQGQGRPTPAEVNSVVPAFLVTTVFALHPLQSASVMYISGRGDTLLLLFTALGLLTFERWLPASLAFSALAVFSKESGMLFPFFLFCFRWAESGGDQRALQREWRRHLPFWALVAGYFSLRLTVLNFVDWLNFYGAANLLTEHPEYRFFTYFSTLPKKLLLMFAPWDLHHERSWPVYTSLFQWPSWAGAMLFSVVAGAAVGLRKRKPLVAAGLLWALGATFPTSNLVVLINALFYDHWALIPFFGVCLAMAGLLNESAWLRSNAGRVWGIWAAALLPLAAVTWQQNSVWHDPVSLYRHILHFEPGSVKIMNNLAMHEEERGETARARELYERAIAESDVYAETHHNLGLLYFRSGNPEKAISELEKATQMNPAFHPSRTWLGIVHADQGRYDAAVREFQHSLRIFPTPLGYQGLIAALRAQGAHAQAFEAEQALRRTFGGVVARENR